MGAKRIGLITLVALVTSAAGAKSKDLGGAELFWMQLKASNSAERTEIANVGVAIEQIEKDYVLATGNASERAQLEKMGVLEHNHKMDLSFLDYPSRDSQFHNYAEMVEFMNDLGRRFPDLIEISDIGNSLDGRKLMLATVAKGQRGGKPEIFFVGGHHAREHISTELPLGAMKYLVENYATNERVRRLVDNRVIYFVPSLNPDGAEHDIADSRYKSWRKNRRPNGDGTVGVDLNRNYGYLWGGVGASPSPGSQTYRGPHAFSEPETQAVRDFVNSRTGLTTLISFHTFSELILYPWGHTDQKIDNQRDLQVFETMASKMAEWNGYRPQQSAQLYKTTGDTSDWAYGEHGLITFTFELDPRSIFQGGFYPGQSYIQRVFDKNIEPILYLIEYSDNPYRVLEPSHTQFGLNSPII